MRFIHLKRPRPRDVFPREKDPYRVSRICYILEAALEYFISMVITGAYLAKLTAALGLSDSLTGILSSFVSLGCTFQIIAVFCYRKQSVKRSVIWLHILNQLLFTFIYVVPLFDMSAGMKTAVFIVALLAGYIISNIINAPKINWLMSLVDDSKRGTFTANKEIISLLGGMIFSLIMGNMFDRLSEAGEIRKAFILCAVVVFVLTVLHTLTLIFSKEKPVQENAPTETFRETLRNIFSDSIIIKVILVETLWNIAHYVATPFYGTYQVHELKFSMTFIAVLGVIYSLTRVAASRFLGKYADRHSFAQMLLICVSIAGVGFLVNAFCTPENGYIVFTTHYILYAVSMAGINSATINLIFDYVKPHYRREALAMKAAVSGTAGFVTTAVASSAVTGIQNAGNTFLGMHIYAQQLMSALAFILCAGLTLYIRFVIIPAGKAHNQNA